MTCHVWNNLSHYKINISSLCTLQSCDVSNDMLAVLELIVQQINDGSL